MDSSTCPFLNLDRCIIFRVLHVLPSKDAFCLRSKCRSLQRLFADKVDLLGFWQTLDKRIGCLTRNDVWLHALVQEEQIMQCVRRAEQVHIAQDICLHSEASLAQLIRTLDKVIDQAEGSKPILGSWSFALPDIANLAAGNAAFARSSVLKLRWRSSNFQVHLEIRLIAKVGPGNSLVLAWEPRLLGDFLMEELDYLELSLCGSGVDLGCTGPLVFDVESHHGSGPALTDHVERMEVETARGSGIRNDSRCEALLTGGLLACVLDVRLTSMGMSQTIELADAATGNSQVARQSVCQTPQVVSHTPQTAWGPSTDTLPQSTAFDQEEFENWLETCHTMSG